ncbi:Platelet-activating factor acetylhydrolase 2, cytoplasmic [Cytospora mali]|uniref:Putative phospholipase n=1 Tax=Cytospora mali TaxID=578113 RepID=A0A194UZK4_CYTMA|nr:Platelet-activating factor acetylhydrolase 2, cytoplasmic [Valsa mali var. pyri (nom. inval.)]
MEEHERQKSQDKQPILPPHPPKTWRENLVHTLPYYTGPYSVGYLEIELPAENPRTFSHIRRDNRHALQLDTVLFSVFYPTNADPKAEHRPPWLPRPRVPTCKGYSKLYNVPNFPMTTYMAFTCMFTKLPAFRNAGLATKSPTSTQETSESGKPKFPVVIFSHGLGGSRTMCSTICGDLASYGFVVVAMEHRDGSGARTYVNVPPDRNSPELSQDEGSITEAALKEQSMGAQKDEKPKRVESYMVDYIFPKENALDTSPHNELGVDHELREAQIEMRLAEVEEAFRVLQIINAGDPNNTVKHRNLRKKPNRGSSSRGLDGIDWADWKDRLGLENVTAMGHSFGGATTVQILRLDDRFHWIGQGILLDAWGPAAPEVKPGSEQRITKPLLSIGSEAFMHWGDNFSKIDGICKEAKDSGALCWMLTVRGSTHLSQTDFAVLYPKWMSNLVKTLIHPLRGIYLTIAPSLEFLKLVLPPQQTTTYDTSGWVDEGLLRRSHPDSQISSAHKPDDKWIAARLKIDHELQIRMQGWWARRRQRRQQAGGGDHVPRDVRGQPLFGLQTWGPGEEIWVHMCPTQDEVERRREEQEPSGGMPLNGDQDHDDVRRPEPMMRCPTT